MDIRCRKTQCKFNDRHTCRAKEICVNRQDVCEKYEPKEDKIMTQELSITDDRKVLALCDLSDSKNVVEIKTYDVLDDDIDN